MRCVPTRDHLTIDELIALDLAALAGAIAAGRLSGHVPVRCPVCGACSMAPAWSPQGTARGMKSAPWPRCRMTPRCVGAVEPVEPVDVDKVRPPAVKRAGALAAPDPLPRCACGLFHGHPLPHRTENAR